MSQTTPRMTATKKTTFFNHIFTTHGPRSTRGPHCKTTGYMYAAVGTKLAPSYFGKLAPSFYRRRFGLPYRYTELYEYIIQGGCTMWSVVPTSIQVLMNSS